MGLAKKGTSTISVEGVDYRWVVSANDGFLDLLIEEIRGQGQRLSVQLDYSSGETTPKRVRVIILSALEMGWCPLDPGKEIRFRFEGEELIPWASWLRSIL